MITSTDILRQVAQAVEAGPSEGIDVDAIVTEIVQTYGLVDIDTIDTDAFWAIVARHDTTQA